MISMTGDKRKAGFSLVEILVVVTLFTTAAVILSQMFISFNRLHRKVSNTAILTQDMRFAMELLVREARNKSVDYASYADESAVASSTSIHLSGTTDRTDIQVRTAECNDVAGVSCLAISKDGGLSWAPITAKRVNVTFFGAYVRPSQSPFEQNLGYYLSSAQPMVTANIALEYVADNPKDNVSLQAQTTVSTRVYRR